MYDGTVPGIVIIPITANVTEIEVQTFGVGISTRDWLWTEEFQVKGSARLREAVDRVTLDAIETALNELPTYEEESTVAGQHMREVWGRALDDAHMVRAASGLPPRPHGREEGDYEDPEE